ncbi:tRNA (uridine(54)-C5)-methyltransferase TrmA [Helicobacter cholecystus]|uniref:tRNA (uridine(54)-C5)-methyltransferase TrmA n=1 Tax=Helicobacter cholecystus TaxID=45498 RepID=UPI000F6C8F2C|nr:tRNA (uridine(54)-C5)-methyltransferase TrmA [Helicobacter cholecystus]VEJ26135.1 tRNA (uracil-5-)-methyltransferase [Helicobacter cholecystus]
MKCQYFNQCRGCSLPLDYEVQLQKKIQTLKTLGLHTQEIYTSPKEGFRSRAEFRIYRDHLGLHYAMSIGNQPLPINSCPILLPHLQELLKQLLPLLNASEILKHKLFSLEVLGTLQGESLLTLLYHRPLDHIWESEAKKLEEQLKIQIIGRSKGKKNILSGEYLQDKLLLEEKEYSFIRYDNAFSQPNPYTNIKMLEFVLKCVREAKNKEDLLELYCGGGNFTIPLAQEFHKVFATEIAKNSIKALHQNIQNNHLSNIFCARLSGEESIEALRFQRDFFRLREVDLGSYNFSHILIDPPRSGVGNSAMLNFISSFKNIIYISCNPCTLKEDLDVLLQTHEIKRFALFDQFPYTHHIESGVWLQKKTTPSFIAIQES